MEEDDTTPPLGHGSGPKALAELRRVANHTSNNLAVWQALAVHLGGREAFDAYDKAVVQDGDTVAIPAWCAQYLLQAALNIGELSEGLFRNHLNQDAGLSPDAALEMLPRAMGLSGSGWNAFRRAVSTWEVSQDWRMFSDARERGLSYAEAVEAVRKFRNLGSGPGDQRAAARRIAQGRKLAEAVSKPTP